MRSIVCLLALLGPLATAAAQEYPTRPIKIIATSAPGTPIDISARRIADGLAPLLGQPVIVENRAGAGGTIGTDVVAKSAPDGYTLGISTLGTLCFAVGLYKSLSYDPIRDFAPVTRIDAGYNVIIVPKDSPATTLSDLVKLAKERQSQGKPLNYASGGVGTGGHLQIELLKQVAGIDMVHVPYKGSSPALSDLLGGHVDVMSAGPPMAIAQANSGALKAIGVDTPERSPQLPNVGTFKEAGLENAALSVWIGLVAPAGTPAPIVDKLHKAVLKILDNPAIQADFAREGTPISPDASPADFARAIRADIEKWTPIIRAANISAD